MRETYERFDIGLGNAVDLSLPLSIQIELTESCNLKCPFCYNNSGWGVREELQIEKWKKFLLNLEELGGVFQCAFSGGEPLLYKNELLELMDILHANKTGLMLITNGYFLDASYAEKLAKYNWYWIQVSVDSYKANVHDALRGVNGSFDRAVMAIRELKRLGLPVVISSVICSENINDIFGIVELAYELNVNVVLFSPILPIGRSLENIFLQLTEEQEDYYKKTMKFLVNEYSPGILVRSAASYEEQLESNKSTPPYGLLIRPNGDVKIDCLSKKIVGNVFESSIDAIWKEILKEERWKK